MRILPTALLLPILLPSLATAQEGQRLDGQRLVDEDYRFVLEDPGTNWRLLPEATVRTMSPDAIAGLLGEREAAGVLMFVVAERMPDISLEDFADLIVGTIPLEAKEELDRRPVRVAGQEALRVDLSGRLGFELRYAMHFQARGDFRFQYVLGGAPGPMSDERLVAQALGAVRHLDGEIAERATGRPLEDTHGIGWRLRDGRFESVAHGLEASPPEGFRLALGDELDQLASDAEVGLIGSLPDVFVTLTVESARGEDAPLLLALVAPDPGQEMLEFECLGAPRTLQLSRDASTGVAFEFLQGAWLEAGRLYQLVVWYAEADRETVLQRLPAALSCMRPLPADRLAALHAELAALEDNDGAITETQALFGGTFVDFDAGVAWTKPATGYWRAAAGASLAALDELECELFVEAPGTGIVARLYVDADTEIDDARAYHELSVDAYTGDFELLGRSEPRQVTPGERGVLATDVDLRIEGTPFRFTVATVRRPDLGADLVLSGLRSNVTEERDAVEALLRGLSLLEGSLEPQQRAEGRFVDRRFGFACRLPDGHRLTDRTPPELGPTGRAVQVRVGRKDRLFVLTVQPPSVGASSIETLAREVGRLVPERVRGGGEIGAWLPSSLGDRSTLGAELSVGSRVVGEVHAFSRDARFFLVLLSGDERERASAAELLELLDTPLAE